MPTLQDLLGEMRKTGIDMWKIAAGARDSGFIDDRMHTFLKLTVLLDKPKTSKTVARMLGTTDYGVSVLEENAYNALMLYVDTMSVERRLGIDMDQTIDQLKWSDGMKSHAVMVLSRPFGKTPTIRQVYGLYAKASTEGRRLMVNRYGKKLDEATRVAYRKMGVELPPVRSKEYGR